MFRYCWLVTPKQRKHREDDGAVVGLDACAPGCAPRDPTGTVAAVRSRLPDGDAFVRSAEVFRLLGDPTRVALLAALAEGGELCVCDLAEVVGVSENVVSQAMRLLRASDVVRTRREGRRIHYRLADAHVRLLLDVTVDHVAHGAGSAADGATAPRRVRGR